MNTLKKFNVLNYRNIEEGFIECSGGVTLFTGENAQGKTNLLEAIHFMSSLKSFRTRALDEIIKNGCQGASIHGLMEDELGGLEVNINLHGGSKELLVNKKKPSSMADYLKIFPAVYFGPEDMDIADGNQKKRRRYIDRAVFDGDINHLERMRRFSRVLKQRNAALEDRRFDLDPWTGELAKVWCEIDRARKNALSRLKEIIKEIDGEISGGRDDVELSIENAGIEKASSIDDYLEALNKMEKAERARKTTLLGPHRDRLSIRLGTADIAEHGSRGQKRTVCLSLKLALMEWSKEVAGLEPAFLLDDPGSELDQKRLGILGEKIAGSKGQVFIATVREGDVPLPHGIEKKVYRITRAKAELIG